MREYKFRGKRWDNEEWVYGYFVKAAGVAFMYAFATRDMILLNPHTVGQYTGLKDKSDVEIYEGDIVTVKDYFCTRQFEGVVKFDNGSFLINQDDWEKNYRWQDYECEVIGNIHDRKELI